MQSAEDRLQQLEEHVVFDESDEEDESGRTKRMNRAVTRGRDQSGVSRGQ